MGGYKALFAFCGLESIPPNNTDKLVRIRPVLKRFHDTFHAAVQGEEFQSLDEMLIPFKGRSQLKQYLRKKKNWGSRYGSEQEFLVMFTVLMSIKGEIQPTKNQTPLVLQKRLCLDFVMI